MWINLSTISSYQGSKKAPISSIWPEESMGDWQSAGPPKFLYNRRSLVNSKVNINNENKGKN